MCKLKNDNFKTRDFSPLIERVLAGVMYYDNYVSLTSMGFDSEHIAVKPTMSEK